MKSTRVTRRSFVKSSALIVAAPAILPTSVFGRFAPSNRINLGVIGAGRIAHSTDIPEFLAFDDVQIVAVCDVDRKRMLNAKKQVEEYYAKKATGAAGISEGGGGGGATSASFSGCTMYDDFRELIAQPHIDAVAICTPDHWHALPALVAAKAGKDIFIQKPLTLTVAEGRVVSDAVHRHGNILQVGSQQRSDKNFRHACELVRNGRIGELKRVLVGLPGDPGCGDEPEMPVPPNLNYDMWLGQTPAVPYTEKRVHPQNDYGRPGWLRIEAYGAGMITGWGTHHLDTAQWAMDTEYTGPVALQGEAAYPQGGLWNVHGPLRIEYTYASGVKLICADNKTHKQGVLFEGSEGWIYVKRGQIDANPKSVLESKIGPDEIHLYKSDNHKRNFLDCIRTRRQPIAPVEVAHRSCTICLIGNIATKLDHPLEWDPAKERFRNDDEANSMLSRPERLPWRLADY